jgi:hypothetical protein
MKYKKATTGEKTSTKQKLFSPLQLSPVEHRLLSALSAETSSSYHPFSLLPTTRLYLFSEFFL